jgi:hypothetical protein
LPQPRKDNRRAAHLILLALAGLVLVVGPTSQRRNVWRDVSDQSDASTPVLERPVFRLGNAGQPFGWTTAVADFNRDGIPDVAVADRVDSRFAAGYAYEIDFSISGRINSAVWFDSPSAALTISVSDVDDDNDLDVLVTEPVTRAVTSVLLNDGQGRFTQKALPLSPARMWAATVLDDEPFGAALLAALSADRCPLIAIASTCFESLRTNCFRCWFSPIHRSARLVSTGCRAPPSSQLSST